MKKVISLGLALLLIMGMLAGCASEGETPTDASGENTQAQDPTEQVDQEENETTASGPISVLSREDGSGTRSAFIELMGIEGEDDSGETVDNTVATAEITNSTSVMMTTVAGNTASIGYISLGSLNETVKALQIDGVEATAENVKNGTYQVSRPFNIATKEDVSEAAADLIAFILSDDGQAIVEEEGYISQESTGAYTPSGMSGKITISGSSSITPVMEKLTEAYKELNPDVTIELQQSDSSTGMMDVISGTSDIGMASRELKDSELSEGITPTVIALDGIAVIVNNESPITGLTSEQVMKIYTGEITDWSEIQ